MTTVNSPTERKWKEMFSAINSEINDRFMCVEAVRSGDTLTITFNDVFPSFVKRIVETVLVPLKVCGDFMHYKDILMFAGKGGINTKCGGWTIDAVIVLTMYVNPYYVQILRAYTGGGTVEYSLDRRYYLTNKD